MTCAVYVSGEYLPEKEAKVSVLDRCVLMATRIAKWLRCWVACWVISPGK